MHMRKTLTTLALILALATPLFIATGCRSPVGKAFVTDTSNVASVQSAMTRWYALVVADKVTAPQEIEMRSTLNSYLKAEKEIEAIVAITPVDLNALSVAQAHLATMGAAVIALVNAVNK
jgi:hypothetical protein